jgi:hypothetical protein
VLLATISAAFGGIIEGTTMNLVTYDSSGNPILDGTAQLVPEPTSYALFGLGAIAILMVLRRKNAA